MEIGLIVTGSSGKRYRIERYLGEGVTSLVYAAVEEGAEPAHSGVVALKMLRPQVGEIIEANFWQEAQILGELANAARSAGDARPELVEGVSHVPRVLETQRGGEWPFLAMELVTGVPLDRELEEKTCLPEPEALFVAREVLHVLVLLHEQVRRTYTDFQLQNIWLQRSEPVEESEGVLTGVKVMDWNHVSERVKEGEPLPEGFGHADLARFGAYFYRMLTGKGADERGEHERALQKRAGEQWEALSLGTKQLVMQALHPNPARRYANAHSFYEAVQAQHALWQEDWMDVLGEVRKTLEESHSDETWVESVELRLDMAQRLGATKAHINYYQQQLAPQTSKISRTWDAGQQYYKVGQYRSAAEKWRAEAQARGRVDLWRWVMLADAGAALGDKIFEPVRETLEEVVQALDEHQWAQARNMLDGLVNGNKAFLCEPVETLRADTWLHSEVENAQAYKVLNDVSSWEKAAKAYRTALAGLKAVDYANLIVEEHGWHDIEQRAEKWEQRVKAHQRTQQVGNALEKRLRKNFQDGLKQLKFELQHHPTDQGALQLCLKEGTRLFKAGKVQKAAELLEIGLFYGQAPASQMDELRKIWQKARQILREAAQKKAIEQAHAEDLAALKEEYRQKFAQLRTNYDNNIGKEKQKYEAQLKPIQDQYEQELKVAQQQHEEQLAAQQTKNEQELARRQEQDRNVLTAVQEDHQKTLQTIQNQSQEAWEKHEQALSAQKKKYEQELLAQKEEYEQALLAQEEEYTKQKLQKLLDEGRWDEFLELVNQVSDSLLADATYWEPQRIRKIKSRFFRELGKRLMPIADKLRQVLYQIDPNEIERKRRDDLYDQMKRDIEIDQAKWEQYIKHDILDSIMKKDPQQYGDIIFRIQLLLPFSKEYYPQLTTWLEETHQLLYKGPPKLTSSSFSQTEWEAWLGKTVLLIMENKKTTTALSQNREQASEVAPEASNAALVEELPEADKEVEEKSFFKKLKNKFSLNSGA